MCSNARCTGYHAARIAAEGARRRAVCTSMLSGLACGASVLVLSAQAGAMRARVSAVLQMERALAERAR